MVVRGFHVLPFLFVVLCSSAGRANADPVVVFDNFGPRDSFDIGGPNDPFVPVFSEHRDTGAPFFVGFAFTPAHDGVLKSVSVAISSRELFGFGPATAVTLAIRNRGVDGTPQTVLGTLRVNGLSPYGTPYNPLTAVSENDVMLFAGVPYWLTATTVSGAAVWNFNSVGHTGEISVTEPDGCCVLEFGTTGAFRVTATPAEAPVPEPSTILLLSAAGTIELFRRRSRARNAIRDDILMRL
jgi:hypothetical protein